ncbi:MAG: redoxin family protein [Rhizobiales bacterium]|nr:redoxin family protein [Hyphomicrobiales bacterium]
MISRRTFLSSSIIGGAALFGAGAYGAWSTGRIQLGPTDLPDAELPPVPGVLRNGQPVPGFSTFRRDTRPIVVNFWASWCPYCRSEHDLLMQLSKENRIKLVGIVTDDGEANVARYLAEHGNPFEQLSIDTRRLVVRAMRQRGIPTTMLIPPGENRVAFRHVGPLSDSIIAAEITSRLA